VRIERAKAKVGVALRDPGSRGTAAKSSSRCARRWRKTFVAVGIAAEAHLVTASGLWVLAVVPIMETKTALPRFGHAQIVLPAQWVWSMGLGSSLVRARARRVRIGVSRNSGHRAASPNAHRKFWAATRPSFLRRKFWALGRRAVPSPARRDLRLLVEIVGIPDCDIAHAVCVPHLEHGAVSAERDPARRAFANPVRLIPWI
jgi:hypothetical protein